jgi:hypothetical protein
MAMAWPMGNRNSRTTLDLPSAAHSEAYAGIDVDMVYRAVLSSSSASSGEWGT